jgi:DNA-nicking Smr family endonuclease
MNIGDKVRLLRGREEGIVVGFGANNIVQIEIEDGFQIPALRSEVVVVAAEESQRFRREEPVVRKGVEPRAIKEVVSVKGIFFAFIPLNDVNLTRKIRFRANTFFKNKAKAPLLDKDAYLLQLDKEESAAEIKPEQIVEGLFDKTGKAAPPDVSKPPAEVDLHIEKLSDNYTQMSSPDIIGLQLRTFEQSLENAIATGMTEITFIHGVGNGVLRTELHRRLSKHPSVKFYQDARKEKFGYGATVVTIK